MRLIDADELKAKLQEHHDFFVNAYGGSKNLPPNDKARVDEITHCISEVVNAPTVNTDEIYKKGYHNGFFATHNEFEITNKDIQNAITQGYQVGYEMAVAKYERPQGEYKTACNVLLSLERIVRSSNGWEDSAVEAVHNAVQTAIKCMHERAQGEWKYVDYGNGCGNWHCSNCLTICCEMRLSKDNYKYCPNCGASMMKGGEKE